MTVIAKVELWVVKVPLLQEWTNSEEFGIHGHTSTSNRYILCITDDAGNEAWAESPERGNRAALETALQHLAASRTPFYRHAMLKLDAPERRYWERPAEPSPYAPHPSNNRHRLRHPWQGLIESALCDLLAKRAGVPLCQLWGGPWRDTVAVDYWMGRTTPDHAKRCVERARQLGFRGIKLKTTLEDPNIERLEAIRDAGGADWQVTVDPNGRFHRLEDAMPTLRAMDQVGNMAILEDPFPHFHLAEFSALRTRIRARVVVHVDPPEALWPTLQSGGAGGLNLNSIVQGPEEWRMDAATAERANLSIWHGSNLDLGIGTAMQLHLAASVPNCRLPGDQAGPWLRKATLLKTDFALKDGRVKIPSEGAGLGIQVDRDQLDDHAVSFNTWGH